MLLGSSGVASGYGRTPVLHECRSRCATAKSSR